jgi:hypothetical protein
MSLRLQKSAAGADEKHRPIAIVEGGARAGQYLFLTDPFHTPPPQRKVPPIPAKQPQDPIVKADEDWDEGAAVRAHRRGIEELGGRAHENENGEDRADAHAGMTHIRISGAGAGGPPSSESDSSSSSSESDEEYEATGAGRRRKRVEKAAADTKRARAKRGDYARGVTRIDLAPDEHFLIEPTHLKGEFRDIVYLSGQSGCGKSTAIKKFAERYRRIWPKRHIVLVSALEEDSTLRTNEPPLYIQRLNLDSLVEDPVKLDELQDVLLIFDDVEGMPKETAIAVQELADLVGNRGRHQATSLLYASHLSTDYKRTRNLLMESHWYVFYPSATSAKQLLHLLSTYGGLDREQVQTARRLPSRWVALRKMYPPSILFDGGAYILHDTNDKPAKTKALKKAVKKIAGAGWADHLFAGGGGADEDSDLDEDTG